MLRVTVDTNVLEGDIQRIGEAVKGLDVGVAPTTVTLRERGLTNLPNEVVVMETGVWDESRWGQSVWGRVPRR
jgi:hypothetical protein